MAYKRKRTYAPRRTPFKRRRFGRGRTSYRRKRSTAQAGNDKPYGTTRYRSKRLSRRTFKSLLWKQTITKTKYHSRLAQTGAINTPADTATATTIAYWALGVANHAYEPFWTYAGGCLALSSAIPGIADATEAYASFDSDIVIRGGSFSVEVYNNTEVADLKNDVVRVKLLLLKTSHLWNTNKGAFESAVIFGLPARNCVPDFNRNIGYICAERDFAIKDGESVRMDYRIPCQKVDVGSYMNGEKAYLLYIVAGNGFEADAQSVRYRFTHDISFCGDAIT